MSVFHAGEVRAQALAEVNAVGTGIRDYMPDQHRTFFEGLPYVMMATLDADGSPRARVLSGEPGFVSSPDAHTLRVAGTVASAGSNGALDEGAAVGLLGLDFSNRRRNRANGVVRNVDGGSFTIDVRESFGNCPQHIRVRTVEVAPPAPVSVREFSGLEERELIARAETFFVATTGGEHGVDISHRGGPAGFVSMEGNVLTVPDFNGNRYFNTLGNLLLDRRAALLFIDFDSGDVLELRGTAEIVWGQGGAMPGVVGGRGWRFTVASGTMSRGMLGLRWSSPAL